MKDDKYMILADAVMGNCPSCKTLMVLPKFTDISLLQICPKCGAWSKGIKWLPKETQECNKNS